MKELFRKAFGKKVWAKFAVYVQRTTMSFEFVGYDSVWIWSDEIKKYSHDYTELGRDGIVRHYEFLGIETH